MAPAKVPMSTARLRRPDPAELYTQCVAHLAALNIEGSVYLKQIAPVHEDSIPAVPLRDAPSLADAVKILRDTHWKGDEAYYEWIIFGASTPRARGTLQFEGEARVSRDQLHARLSGLASVFTEDPDGGWVAHITDADHEALAEEVKRG